MLKTEGRMQWKELLKRLLVDGLHVSKWHADSVCYLKKLEIILSVLILNNTMHDWRKGINVSTISAAVINVGWSS